MSATWRSSRRSSVRSALGIQQRLRAQADHDGGRRIRGRADLCPHIGHLLQAGDGGQDAAPASAEQELGPLGQHLVQRPVEPELEEEAAVQLLEAQPPARRDRRLRRCDRARPGRPRPRRRRAVSPRAARSLPRGPRRRRCGTPRRTGVGVLTLAACLGSGSARRPAGRRPWGVSSGTGGRSSREGGPGGRPKRPHSWVRKRKSRAPSAPWKPSASSLMRREAKARPKRPRCSRRKPRAAPRTVASHSVASSSSSPVRKAAQRERLLARQEVHELALTGGMIHALVPALGRPRGRRRGRCRRCPPAPAAGGRRRPHRTRSRRGRRGHGCGQRAGRGPRGDPPGRRRGRRTAPPPAATPRRASPGRPGARRLPESRFARPGREGADGILGRWSQTEGDGVVEHAPRQGHVDRGVEARGFGRRWEGRSRYS